MSDGGRLRVGLIGFGAIGSSLCELIQADSASRLEVVAALVRDVDASRAYELPVVDTLDALLSHQPAVVAEAAGHEALKTYGPACLRSSFPLVFLSVGALADRAFEEELRSAAAEGGVQATVVSGGIGGLDILASGREGGLSRVVHTIVKSPERLGVASAEYQELYRGSARDAALGFPQNVNVAAASSLAGIGLDRTEVVVAADPNAVLNRQELEIEGAFGRVIVRIESRPHPRNPRSGAVVAMSLKHCLEKMIAPLVIG